MAYVLAYDIGTTGVKTCIFSLEDKITLIADANEGYGLYIGENGEPEQDCDEWWQAMCQTTKKALGKAGLTGEDIAGISFCSQMQGIVLVDENGKALRRPMSYMDQRGSREFAACQTHGLTISGVNALMLLRSLRRTRAASTSVKDPLWKYKWVQQNEPEVYAKIHKWLDVKEYLIGRCTGQFVMTRDSAYSTFLYDSRPDKGCWSRALCRMYGVEFDHLPRIIECTDVAGTLTARAAQDLGLAEGCPVYGGGGDATLIGVGAGCTEVGQTHIYSGTSGWVSTVIGRQKVDIVSMIAGIVGAQAGKYNYFAEMETAGKCFEWVKEHLVLDEIGIYLQKTNVAESQESVYESLYDYMTDTIEAIPPGAGGVIFTPWLHGNRCPFEDPKAAGIFFNLRLDTGKTEMLRAVLEGICYHLRWMLECQDKKVKIASTLRFVGGGALSRVTCQILADVTGRTVETVADTKDVGAVGAAMLVAVGSGQIADLTQAAGLIRPAARYTPDPANQALYDRNYKVFKNLYAANKKNFAALN